MLRTAILAVTATAAVALAGCTLDDVNPDGPDGPSCGTPSLQGLVGQPEAVLQTMQFAQTLRIIRPGMMVTQEFSPSRLNIQIAPGGRIARVWCG